MVTTTPKQSPCIEPAVSYPPSADTPSMMEMLIDAVESYAYYDVCSVSSPKSPECRPILSSNITTKGLTVYQPTTKSVKFADSTVRAAPATYPVKNRQNSHSSSNGMKQLTEPSWPALNAGYIDPRTQNAVRRYRPQAVSNSVSESKNCSLELNLDPANRKRHHRNFSQSESSLTKGLHALPQVRTNTTIDVPDYITSSKKSALTSSKTPKAWMRFGTSHRHPKRLDMSKSPPVPVARQSSGISFMRRHFGTKSSQGIPRSFTLLRAPVDSETHPQEINLKGQMNKHTDYSAKSADIDRPIPAQYQFSNNPNSLCTNRQITEATLNFKGLRTESKEAVLAGDIPKTAISPPTFSSPPLLCENSSSATSSDGSSPRTPVNVDRVPVRTTARNSLSMQPCITNWDRLSQCTPQFIDSMSSMLENIRLQESEPESPCSVYSAGIITAGLYPRPSQANRQAPETSIRVTVQDSQPRIQEPLLPITQPYLLPSTTYCATKSKSSEVKIARKSKPIVSHLIIPTRPPSNIILKGFLDKPLPKLPNPQKPTNSSLTQKREPSPLRRNPVASPSEDESLLDKVLQVGDPAITLPPYTNCWLGDIYNTTPVNQHSIIPQLANQSVSKPQESNSNTSISLAPSSSIKSLYVPAHLTRRLQNWDLPQTANLITPKGGLQLRISRRHLTLAEHEWAIESAISHTPYLKCIAQTNSHNQKMDFWGNDGNHLFEWKKEGGVGCGGMRIAENREHDALFFVRNASLGLRAHWSLSFKLKRQEAEKGVGDGEANFQWVALADVKCRSLVVMRSEVLVGRITVESDTLHHNYILTVNPDVNYSMMAALVTVFDDFRVDEGYI